MMDQSHYKLRLATPEDDAAIGELLVEAYVEAYREKMPEVVVSEARKKDLRDVASKRKIAQVVVLEKSGTLIGTIAVFPPGAAGSEAWLPNATDIRHLAVARSHHGQGLSKLLLIEAERISREIKAGTITLHVRKGAHGVGRLYESMGYQRAREGDLELPHIKLEAYALKIKG